MQFLVAFIIFAIDEASDFKFGVGLQLGFANARQKHTQRKSGRGTKIRELRK